jgi:G3E family GTPase
VIQVVSCDTTIQKFRIQSDNIHEIFMFDRSRRTRVIIYINNMDISRPPTAEAAAGAAADAAPKMKVTVLSGFLGAGKTTLLKRILRENNKREDGDKLSIAVIVNDMGEINLDADEIKNSKLIQEEAEMVEMHNGCICCTLRGDLLKTVKSLSEEGTFDYLVIESTGISEPLPVAQTFVMDVDAMEEAEEQAKEEDPAAAMDVDGGKKKTTTKLTVAEEEPASLSHYAELDTMVSVVDALNIFDVLGSIETLAEENSFGMVGNSGIAAAAKHNAEPDHEHKHGEKHGEAPAKAKDLSAMLEDAAAPAPATEKDLAAALEAAATEQGYGAEETMEDDRSLAQLMLDQIEFANVIVLSKVQILLREDGGKKRLDEIKALLHKLNAKAKIIAPLEDKYGDLDVEKELLRTGMFDMEEASNSAGWIEELTREEHAPETEEYGISSTIFRCTDMPFHPTRLHDILRGFGDYGSALAESTGEAAAEGDLRVFRGVVRSKGSVWLANAHSFPIQMHTAGKQLGMSPSQMPFLGSFSEDQYDDDDKEYKKAMDEKGTWHAEFGDRSSEIVFIGVHLNKELIHEKLTEALLTKEESEALGGVPGWRTLDDPFFEGQCAEQWFDAPEEEDEDEEDEEDDEEEEEEKNDEKKR